MRFEIRTQRLVIQPFTDRYLEDYFQEFTDEITRYQYPDAFQNLEAAREVLSGFTREMEQGNMLELAILSRNGEFLGSAEVFGIRERTPEIGLWLKSAAHGKGYGYEALEGVLEYLDRTGEYEYLIYEADVRNEPSIRLIEKFRCEKGGCEDITTESGKKLALRIYRVFGTGNKK